MRLAGDVIPGARIFAGRDARVQPVRRTVGVGVQIVGLKVNEAALDALRRFAVALEQFGRFADRIEVDLVGGEDRVVRVIDQKRMAGDRHRAFAVEVRLIADDLFVPVVDVHVADGVARLAFLACRPSPCRQ